MKPGTIIILAGILFLAVSCSNEEKAPGAKTSIPAADFNVLMIRQTVANYEAWEPYYLANDSLRMAYGLSKFHIGRGIDDTSMVFVFDKISDVAKAKEFAAKPELKDIMQKAGVTIIDYLHTIRSDTTRPTIKDRVMVKHRVKDFDAWLKMFDEKGMETRQPYGLIDRGLCRGIDDPNMVYIIFAVENWEKANARLHSVELEKIMSDAGVEGTPVLMRYRLVDSNPGD